MTAHFYNIMFHCLNFSCRAKPFSNSHEFIELTEFTLI